MRFDKKDIKIPNGTTIIGEGVFENFTSLRAIDVPDGCLLYTSPSPRDTR